MNKSCIGSKYHKIQRKKIPMQAKVFLDLSFGYLRLSFGIKSTGSIRKVMKWEE